MYTVTCHFQKDGREARAVVASRSPQESADVAYSGDLDLLPLDRFTRLSPSILPGMCEAWAEATGAALDVQNEGEYESWAE